MQPRWLAKWYVNHNPQKTHQLQYRRTNLPLDVCTSLHPRRLQRNHLLQSTIPPPHPVHRRRRCNQSRRPRPPLRSRHASL